MGPLKFIFFQLTWIHLLTASKDTEILKFKTDDGSKAYMLIQEDSRNVDCKAEDLCRENGGAGLAKLDSLASLSMLNGSLNKMLGASDEDSDDLSSDFWLYGSTNVPSSHRIDPATDFPFSHNGGKRCVILSRYNGISGGMDNSYYNLYAKSCSEKRHVLCDMPSGSPADNMHLRVLAYALGALLFLSVLLNCMLGKKKGFSPANSRDSIDEEEKTTFLSSQKLKTIPSIYEGMTMPSLTNSKESVHIHDTLLRHHHNVWKRGEAVNIKGVPQGSMLLLKILSGVVRTPYEVKSYFDELKAIQHINSGKYVLKYIAHAQYEDSPMLITELPSMGNLKQYLSTRRSQLAETGTILSQRLKKQSTVSLCNDLIYIADGVINALGHLHQAGILFSSLSNENVWLCEGLEVKLSGFMLAQDARERALYDRIQQFHDSIQAPETTESGHLSVESNVWQLAYWIQNMFVMMTEEAHRSERLQLQNLSDIRHSICPALLHGVLVQALQNDPELRPTIQAIKDKLTETLITHPQEPIYSEII